jgi:hypothetical protein
MCPFRTVKFSDVWLGPLVPAEAGTQQSVLDSRLRGNERKTSACTYKIEITMSNG